MKVVFTITIIALSIYLIKYGIPMLLHYLTKPYVISETSKKWWFLSNNLHPDVNINDLIFAPTLQNQLHNLLLRVETAQKYNESLPNVLFYGPPGTGKTAFVKALAYASGLDYALTSGSEFAKITDLNDANNELRKLLHWAKNSKKGFIVFIDEAESLFANRKLPMTSKITQDFINTFLSIVPDQSQKNVMFIFATNHPFKLDDALVNRIGISIEFTLPKASEIEKILLMYLIKFAQENKDAIVTISQKVTPMLPAYAKMLDGFSPRAIKFIAEKIIMSARRKKIMQLTHKMAQIAIDEARYSLQKMKQWNKEYDVWSKVSRISI
jgi:ATPase family AAA domain-containing protein 3A/B